MTGKFVALGCVLPDIFPKYAFGFFYFVITLVSRLKFTFPHLPIDLIDSPVGLVYLPRFVQGAGFGVVFYGSLVTQKSGGRSPLKKVFLVGRRTGRFVDDFL